MAKRRSNGEGNIRKRTDNTWEGRITIGGKRMSVYGKTKEEVRKKLTSAQWELDNNIFVNTPADLTVEGWLRAWLANCSSHMTHSSSYQRRQYARLYIIPYIGDKKLKDLSPNDVRGLYTVLVKRGLADNTIRNARNVLRAALNQAVDDEIIKKNVAQKILPPQSTKPPKEIKALSDEEVVRLCDALRKETWGPMLFVDLFTGMRKSELLGLTWDCVDFKNQTIHLYRQLRLLEGTGHYAFTPLKNKKERNVYPPECVFEALKSVQKKQLEQQLRCGDGWQNEDGFVFTKEDGTHLSHKGIYQAFKRVAKQIGVPEARVHDLRHTYATLSLQNGVDPKTISQMLGHATVKFTLDVYTHLTNSSARNAAEKMQNYINEKLLG